MRLCHSIYLNTHSTMKKKQDRNCFIALAAAAKTTTTSECDSFEGVVANGLRNAIASQFDLKLYTFDAVKMVFVLLTIEIEFFN